MDPINETVCLRCIFNKKETPNGQKTSLTGVARESGCENVVECKAEDARSTLEAALASNKKTIIVCKCDSGNIPVVVIGLDPGVIRHRFLEEVAARN